MREDEELCKRCFNHYLVDKLGLQPISWRQGKDPPDYYLTVGCQEFAVEVTSLVAKLSTVSKSISDEDYTVSSVKLCKRIKLSAVQQGILSGCYVIDFNGPFDRFRKISNKIVSKALDYIRDTQSLSKAPHHTIFAQGTRNCSIQKLGNSSDEIGDCIISQDWCKVEQEILEEACHLLKDVISKKKKILEHIILPKILLLRDLYRLSLPQIYRRCTGIDLLDSFHSIFIVKNENEGYFLYTQDRSWAVSSNGDL